MRLRAPWVQRRLADLLSLYLHLTFRSMRWRREGLTGAEGVWDGKGPVIVCFWHGRIALSPACWPLKRAQSPRAMISHSGDGDFVARVVENLGFPAVRGSAGAADKGGARAFRETLKWLRGGNCIAITPDGPRGPAHSVTDGPALLAKASGAQVLLVGLAAAPCRRAGSWDAHVMPLPFGRGAIVWEPPQRVPRDADAAEVARIAADWRERLIAVTDRAEALVA